MDSVIITGEEPKLLQLTVWFQAKYQKDARVTVQIGNRAPLIHNHYMPPTRVYFYDIVQPRQLPLIQVTHNSSRLLLDLSKQRQNVQGSLRDEEVVLWFIYELMNETAKLEQKYWNIKEPQDKVARGDGLNNFVRAESQFLALFQRDQQVEQIRAAETEEQRIEKDISEEIITLRKSKVDLRVIIVLFFLFLFTGFLFKTLQDSSQSIWEFGPIEGKHMKKKERLRVKQKRKRK